MNINDDPSKVDDENSLDDFSTVLRKLQLNEKHHH